jgi:hypothetical protein
MYLTCTPGNVTLEYSSRRFQGHLKTGKLQTCEAIARFVMSVQLERYHCETYPESIRALSYTIMGFFVNDPYRDAVPQQCERSSQSRRTTANLM